MRSLHVLMSFFRRLLLNVETRRFHLEPVRRGWKDAPALLATRLALMPSTVEADLLSETGKPSIRRFTGVAALLGVEALLSAVLALSIWRVGTGFVLAEYTSGPMLLSSTALIAFFIFFGHILASVFFPSLRNRFRAELQQRTDALVHIAWQNAEYILHEHVEAVSRLDRDGHEFLQTIDRIIQSVAKPLNDQPKVDQLFSDETSPPASHPLPVSAEPIASKGERRLPRFE